MQLQYLDSGGRSTQILKLSKSRKKNKSPAFRCHSTVFSGDFYSSTSSFTVAMIEFYFEIPIVKHF